MMHAMRGRDGFGGVLPGGPRTETGWRGMLRVCSCSAETIECLQRAATELGRAEDHAVAGGFASSKRARARCASPMTSTR